MISAAADLLTVMAAGRRRYVTALVLVALGLTACGDGTRGQMARSSGNARGNVLVTTLTQDPGHLNPAITTAGGVQTAANLIYDGLVELDSNLSPIPGLAERWEIERDGALYRFHLRRHVVWHDGQPFTADDVKFTFEEALLQYHARARASLASLLVSIDTPDRYTVEFRFRTPYAPLLQQLNVLEAPIIAAHIYRGTDLPTNPANIAPVGTGPFRFAAYRPGVEIRLEKNPQYFKTGRPRLDGLVMRIVPDPGSQVAAFEAGEIDFLFGVSGPHRTRLRQNADIRFMQTSVNPGGSNCIMTLSFNLDRPILADVRVRRAIAHALDRQQFVDRILFGDGMVAAAPISSGIPFAHASGIDMPAFDLDAADRMLTEAGWIAVAGGTRLAKGVQGVPDGTPLEIEFLHFPSFEPYGALIRAQLRRVGIAVRQRLLEPPVFVDVVFVRRDFDTNIISYCNSLDPEIGVRRMYISSNILPVPFSNAAGYRNAIVDTLFDRARGTVERATRTALYREIQEILVRDLPYFWIVETRGTRAYRARCSGFKVIGHFADEAICRS